MVEDMATLTKGLRVSDYIHLCRRFVKLTGNFMGMVMCTASILFDENTIELW